MRRPILAIISGWLLIVLSVYGAVWWPCLLASERARWIGVLCVFAIGAFLIVGSRRSRTPSARASGLLALAVAFSGILFVTDNVSALVEGVRNDRNPFHEIIGSTQSDPGYVAVLRHQKMVMRSDWVEIGRVHRVAGCFDWLEVLDWQNGPWERAELRVEGGVLHVALWPAGEDSWGPRNFEIPL